MVGTQIHRKGSEVMKKFLATVIVCLLLAGSMLGASAATKSTSNTNTYYSWVGIKIFSIGVTGWYDTNGTKVTSFGHTTASPNCYILWTSSNKSSWWTSTSNTSQAQCVGEAKFCLGVTTEEVTIGVQTIWKQVTATGKP